jgi:hypothetical protein
VLRSANRVRYGRFLRRQRDRELGDVGLSKAFARGAGAVTLEHNWRSHAPWRKQTSRPGKSEWVKSLSEQPTSSCRAAEPGRVTGVGRSAIWSGPGAFLHGQ